MAKTVIDLANGAKAGEKKNGHAAHQVLGGTATNPALFIQTELGKVYLNGNGKADADGNLIGDYTAEVRTVDSLKNKDQQITALWMTAFKPASLAIKQAENNLRIAVLQKKAEYAETAEPANIFALAI